MTLRHLIKLTLLLAFLNQRFGLNDAFVYMDPDEEATQLPCIVDETTKIQELGDDCHLLKFFNQTEVDQLEAEDKLNGLAKQCACQLASMWFARWWESFDFNPSIRRLFHIVSRTVRNDNKTIRSPPYLWTDMDVVAKRISIYTATNDYFEQSTQNKSLTTPPSLRKDEMWKLIRNACWTISQDPAKLYRYLENMNRMSPNVFMRLIGYVEPIEIVYQASKACKMLIILHFNAFKLKPDNDELVPVDPSAVPFKYALDKDNIIGNDIDLMLKGASAALMNCRSWRPKKSSIADLTRECPMMLGDEVPADWIEEHSSPMERSQAAVKCGCQLLLHNSTWETIMRDGNVGVMSKALTNYMNRQKIPDFANAPLWTIHGWFQEIMSKFKNRKMSIKEVIKTRYNDQDPLEKIRNNDFADALELLRRGCNFIVFNYKKGSRETIELKLIKYLDNLQSISQDPLFVFQLSLQDPNLFKLYALSKMCEPIV